MCHVVSFLAAYVILATLQFNKQSRSDFCYEIGEIIITGYTKSQDSIIDEYIFSFLSTLLPHRRILLANGDVLRHLAYIWV